MQPETLSKKSQKPRGEDGVGWLIVRIEGAITMFIALVAVFLLPDLPHNSRGFTEEERLVAQLRIIEDVGEADTDDKDAGVFDGFWMAVKDVKVYLMIVSLIAFVVMLSFNAYMVLLTSSKPSERR